MRQLLLSVVVACLAGCSGSTPPGETTSAATGATSGGSTGTSTASSGTTAGTATSAGATSGIGATSGAATSGGTTASTTGTTSGASGAPCNPTAQPDPCAGAGLACEAPNYLASVEDGGPGGNCALPGELQGCLASVGCDDPTLSCTALEIQVSACVRTCATNADCPLPYTTCTAVGAQGQSVCFYNFCVAPAEIAQPGSYYGSCDASQAGQGTCLPVANPEFDTVGLCVEAGNATEGAPCDSLRDGGASGECGEGLACDGLPFGLPSGACRPVCSFGNDAGPACAAPAMCASTDSLGIPSDLEWGVCLDGCSPTQPCASGSCFAPDEAGIGVCFP